MAEDEADTEVVFIPVYTKKAQVPVEPSQPAEEIEWPQRYREIHYSGPNILNRAESALVCHGYQ